MGERFEHERLGEALPAAVAWVRERLGDPAAGVVVLAPSAANGALAARLLAAAGSYVRVWFLTPEELVLRVGHRRLVEAGGRPEPRGWLETAIAHALPRLREAGALGDHAQAVSRPGWTAALAAAVRALEEAGVGATALGDLGRLGGGLDDRAQLLAALLAAVAEARAADGLHAPGAAAQAALAELAEPRPGEGLAAVRGAVVLGDRTLAPLTHDALSAWLLRAVVARLAIAPLDAVAAAPFGLAAAASGGTSFVVAPRGDRRLDRLKRSLFRAGEGGGPEPPSAEDVTLAVTPDETRELPELVRRVQRAIADGVPLDRIAVVLPDPRHASFLESALAAAEIPATWLTGPPLARAPAARALLTALGLAEGEATVERWYGVLTHPAVRIAAHLGPAAVAGQRRWRSLLAEVADARGTARIVAALGRRAAKATGTDEPAERRARATATLAETMRRLEAELLAPLAGSRPLGAHAEGWARLLRALVAPSEDRGRVLALLESFGAPNVGPAVTLGAARARLEEALAGAEVLSGQLKDAAIRVAPPMALLGDRFDLVLVSGMSDGRFPRRRREDPVLSDALIAALRERLGARLFDSGHVEDLERRRLAAAVAATEGELWLSWPRSELMTGRPLAAGALLLEVASAWLGRRARYSDLLRLARPIGSRAGVDRVDPADALGAAEHLLARLALTRGVGPDAATPEARAAVLALVSSPTGRRLLGLARDVDRGSVGPWTGRVGPGGLPAGAAGERPERAAALARAVEDPAAYFFRDLLGAWPAPRLTGGFEPTDARAIARSAREALERALAAGPGPGLAARAKAEHAGLLAEAAARAGLDDRTLAFPAEHGREVIESLISNHSTLEGAVPVTAEAAPLGPLAPWTLAGPRAFATREGDAVRVAEARGRATPPLADRLTALALRSVRPDLARAVVLAFDGEAAASLDAPAPELEEAIASAVERARRGEFPLLAGGEGSRARPFLLERERRAPPAADPEEGE